MFRRLFHYTNTTLGRWALMGRRESNWKVDMANTDHCGTCAFYDMKHYPPTPTPTPVVEEHDANTLEYYLIMTEMSTTPTHQNQKIH